MNQLRDPLLQHVPPPPAQRADDFGQVVRSTVLSDF